MERVRSPIRDVASALIEIGMGTFFGPARLVAMSSPAELRRKAAECRQLAPGAQDNTAANLLMLAEDYEAEADRVEAAGAEDEAERS